MTENWQSISLRDFVSLKRGHDLPTSQRSNGNIPVAGSNGIVGFHDKSIGIIPGVTIGRSGSIGNTQFFEDKYFPLNTTLYITNFQSNDAKFVYYFFSRFNFLRFDSGSVQPSLNRNFLYTAQVDIPPIPEQKAIAYILGTLDKKIELNKKNNETLEGIARALFKSWFIDFDPVRAKAEGRSTGLSDEISELFPNSFEESELGEIPSGWEINALGDFAKFLNGYAFKSKDWKSEGIPVVKIGSINPGFVDISKVSYVDRSIAEGKTRFQISSGDILIGMTGAYLGQVGMIPIVEKPLLFNQRVGKITSLDERCVARSFIYYWINDSKFYESIKNLSYGSAQPNVSSRNICSIKTIKPSSKVNKIFADICEPIIRKSLNNEAENRKLEKIKDLLLPKLISGELRVPNAAKMIEEAGI